MKVKWSKISTINKELESFEKEVHFLGTFSKLIAASNCNASRKKHK